MENDVDMRVPLMQHLKEVPNLISQEKEEVINGRETYQFLN